MNDEPRTAERIDETPADPATMQPEQLAFHRLALARPSSARWWRPFAVLGITLGLAAAFGAVALVGLVAASLADPTHWTPSAELDDPRNPVDLVFLLGSVAVLLPAVVLASRWGGRLRGGVHSVVGRVRWRLMARAAAVVLPVYAVVHGITFALAPPTDLAWPPVDGRLAFVFVIIILLTPLQCAAEEYAFRALPQQMLGTWLRSPVWGVLVPVPLFMLGHGYDWVGQIDIAVFAVCMGFLVWKSGGVELAIVVHTANNLIVFLFAPFSASSLEQGAVPPSALLLSVPLTLLVTGGLAIWVGRTHGLRLLEPVRGSGRPPIFTVSIR